MVTRREAGRYEAFRTVSGLVLLSREHPVGSECQGAVASRSADFALVPLRARRRQLIASRQ